MKGKDIHERYVLFYNSLEKLIRVCAVKGVFTPPAMEHFKKKGIFVVEVNDIQTVRYITSSWL